MYFVVVHVYPLSLGRAEIKKMVTEGVEQASPAIVSPYYFLVVFSCVFPYKGPSYRST